MMMRASACSRRLLVWLSVFSVALVTFQCTDDISEDKSDLYSHLVRSCPEGTVCGIGSLLCVFNAFK